MRICFDVDGVLADPGDPWRPYHLRDPYPWVSEKLWGLSNQGHIIILQTARYMGKRDGNQSLAHAEGYVELIDWCYKHNIPHDEIYLGKASADLYVDDRGCRVESKKGMVDWEKINAYL